MGVLGNEAGKVAIVTGAARGIGAGYARALAELGMSVVVTDLRDCSEVAESIASDGGKALALTTDVTKADSTREMAAAAVAEFGGIDVLVNNAAAFGNLKAGFFDEIDPDEWDFCFDVNVKGIWQCCKAVVPQMRKRGGGSIVNISSMACVYGRPYFLHYSSAKGAVLGITRSLARELGRDNIRVNSVAPVMTDTPGMRETVAGNIDKLKERTIKNQCLRHPLEVEDQLGTLVYLASDMSKYVTGQTMMVDGGTVFL